MYVCTLNVCVLSDFLFFPRTGLEQDLASLNVEIGERQTSWNSQREEISKENKVLSQQLSEHREQVSGMTLKLTQVHTFLILCLLNYTLDLVVLMHVHTSS